MIQVILCDDQSLIRDGLELLLKLESDIEVIAKASNGNELFIQLEKYKPDLVLMDLKMPGMNGIEATRKIKKIYANIKILVLTTYDDDEWLFDALRAGASGYLLKDTPREEVVKAIRGTVNGNSFLDPSIAGKLIKSVTKQDQKKAVSIVEKLTQREKDVLQLIAKGLNNHAIAEKLFLSEGTVRNHVSVILEKLGVEDRTQAAILAIKHEFDV